MVTSVCPAQARELGQYWFWARQLSPVCSWTVQTRVNLLRDTCLDVYNGSTRQLDVTGGDGNMTNSGDWSLGSTEHQEPDRQLAA